MGRSGYACKNVWGVKKESAEILQHSAVRYNYNFSRKGLPFSAQGRFNGD